MAELRGQISASLETAIRQLSGRGRSFAIVLMAGVLACHSTAPGIGAPRERPAPELSTLPATASFAWVRPLALFPQGTSEDDESAQTGAVRLMRLDVEAVLRGRGWVEAPAESAQFVATIVIERRTTYRTEERPAAPGTEPMPKVCDATRSGSTCRPSPPPRTVTVRVPESTARAVLAIRRRADGARREFAVASDGAPATGGFFAKEVLTLLLVPGR